MDYFFWGFNEYCKAKGHRILWFFPNDCNHGSYDLLDIIDCDNAVEEGFVKYSSSSDEEFDKIVTHFVEICTPFYKQAKQHHPESRIIAVDHNPRPIDGYPLKKRFQKKLKSKLYSKYIDLFVGVSQYTVDELIKDFGKRIADKTELVYNGILTAHIETSDKRKRLNSDGLKFMTIAHLRESKGIQDLLAALGILKRKKLLGDIQFDLYGDGPYREQLEQMTREENLASNVNFKGSVSDLPKRFPDYSYMVLPTYMECFSLAILESLAANVPVITTTVGGNMEAVLNGENGFIYKEGEIPQLAGILENVITNRASIDKDIHEKIREVFSIENMITNHYDLLKCT
jgi:glycosyltransferase involved in cell wall biosynthesis